MIYELISFHYSSSDYQVAVAFAAVAGVVLYRLSILAAFYACQNKFITNYALILTNTTAAFINLLFIVVLNVVSFGIKLRSFQFLTK